MVRPVRSRVLTFLRYVPARVGVVDSQVGVRRPVPLKVGWSRTHRPGVGSFPVWGREGGSPVRGPGLGRGSVEGIGRSLRPGFLRPGPSRQPVSQGTRRLDSGPGRVSGGSGGAECYPSTLWDFSTGFCSEKRRYSAEKSEIFIPRHTCSLPFPGALSDV